MLLSSIILLTATIIGILIVLKKIIENIRHYLAIIKLPGPPSSNFLYGNIMPLLTSREKFFKYVSKWSLKYYPIYQVHFGHLSVVVISSPEDMELILTNMNHITKSLIYDFLHKWLGTGLLTSTGQKWHTRRKILTPAFHFNILQQFIQIFNDESECFVNEIKDEIAKENSNLINVTKHTTKFTLKSITETAMGTKIDTNNKMQREYKDAIFEIGEVYLQRVLKPWLYVPIVYGLSSLNMRENRAVKKLHNFTKDVIAKRQENFKQDSVTKVKKLAMLDLLLAQKMTDNSINDEGIREEVDTFTFEGHDTTRVAITYAIMLIACHKNVQDALIQEMHQVLGDNIKTKPTYYQLLELKYMDRVLKETLRLYPSVYFISRILGEDLKTNSGYLLPKNTIIILHIYSMHRNPKIFPEPEKFDPDRFLPENCQNRHSFAYVPFSAGPRNCIGQKFAMFEMKTVLCAVLSHFILEPHDTPESISLVVDIVLRTEKAVKVKFLPRN